LAIRKKQNKQCLLVIESNTYMFYLLPYSSAAPPFNP
jgi:hypothetical protein